MITIQKGNVLNIDAGVVVHGCNSHGIMGGGIAKEISTRFPEAFNVYRKQYTEFGLELGSFTYVHLLENKIIVNGVTQQNFGNDPNIRYASYDAISDVFKNLVNNTDIKSVSKRHGFHFPLIGCGLGNAKWEIVERIIDIEIDDSYQKTLWIL